MEDTVEKPDHNCQSCDQPDDADEEMVICSSCKLWEHFSCAGVDERIKHPKAKYFCKKCVEKNKPSNSAGDNLLKPCLDGRSTKGSKAGSKVGSKRGKKYPDPPDSATSSVRAALLTEELKLIEEEQRLQEQDLLEQEAIRKQQLKEEERQLEEKRLLVEEKNKIRERMLIEELAMKRKQQQIRKRAVGVGR